MFCICHAVVYFSCCFIFISNSFLSVGILLENEFFICILYYDKLISVFPVCSVSHIHDSLQITFLSFYFWILAFKSLIWESNLFFYPVKFSFNMKITNFFNIVPCCCYLILDILNLNNTCITRSIVASNSFKEDSIGLNGLLRAWCDLVIRLVWHLCVNKATFLLF